MLKILVTILVPLLVLLSSQTQAVNVNKYDWNKAVKWRVNVYGEPVDVCYNYIKNSVDYRQCKNKAKQLFAKRCRYGQSRYCSDNLRRSSVSKNGVNRTKAVKKAGKNSVILK